MSQNNQGKSPSNPDYEFENYIGYVIISMIAIVGFIMLVQHVAFVAKFFFAPFAVPVWAAGNTAGTFGSFFVILIYAVLCVIIQLVNMFVRKKKGWFWASYAALFLFLAGLEMATGTKLSFLTSHIDQLCNPSTSGLGAIFSCQNAVADIQQLSTVNIIIMCFIPNLVFAWPLFYKVVTGIIKTINDHPFSRATRVHDVDSFISEMKVQYAHLRYYDIINPNELPLTEGPLRLMDGSRMFVFQNDLVSNFTVRPNLADSSNFGKQFGKTPVPPDLSYYDFKADDMVPVLDSYKFERLMNEQLGEPWAGPDNLSASLVIVLAVALPRACSLDESMDEKEADSIVIQCEKLIEKAWIWVSAQLLKPEDPNSRGLEDFPHLEEYRDIIRKWLEHPRAQLILKEHAYNTTILYRALEDAKQTGVMQPSNFRYLKEYDRSVWAVVQNVGRPSGFAENIASIAHYKAERREGVAINKPRFQDAYNGLLDRVREFNYPKEQIAAWHKWKTEGDPSEMIHLGMASATDNVFGEEWMEIEGDEDVA